MSMDSAPKDEWIILYRPTLFKGHRGLGRWDDDRYAKTPKPYWEQSERWIGKLECRAHLPTHWMPMEPAPTPEDPV